MTSIGWGILGCGDVTEVKSGPAFAKIKHSELVAVMRRNADKARDYAARHKVPRWYDRAEALIHDPDVLILDEPTDGLDPNQKWEVRNLINNMAQDKCIIVSTHILEEVEAICTRMIIIARGKILADAQPNELKEKYKCSMDEVFRKITKHQSN